MKLNCGCGPIWLPGYVNVDSASLTELAANARNAGLPERPLEDVEFMQADLSEPWPWPDGSAEHILADNFLEHLEHPGLTFFLSEALRVLQAGGEMVGGVPDFWRVWCHYCADADWSWEPAWVTSGPYKKPATNALQNFAHGWDHKQVFTLEMLQERLESAGFDATVIHNGTHGLRYTARKPEAHHG